LPTYLTYAADRRQLCWSQNADLRIMPTPLTHPRPAAVLATFTSA
jgi:hypothetical protein